MDRRHFLVSTSLKLAGLVAAANAFQAMPVAAAGSSLTPVAAPARALVPEASPSVARLRVAEAGTYQVSGTVRLNAPLVEIQGITNSQQITWSGAGSSLGPVASFTSFEAFSGPGLTPEIKVTGGSLESVSITLVDYQ